MYNQLNKNQMKKVFLVLALVAGLTVTSCKQAGTSETSTADSTEVVVDSVQVDSTVVDTVSAK
jgi:hypothetical protein